MCSEGAKHPQHRGSWQDRFGSHAAVAATSQEPHWHVSLPSETWCGCRGSADLWSVPAPDL